MRNSQRVKMMISQTGILTKTSSIFTLYTTVMMMRSKKILAWNTTVPQMHRGNLMTILQKTTAIAVLRNVANKATFDAQARN